MDHIEEQVVLLYLHYIAVVFELCPAFGTKENNAVILQTYCTRRYGANILHHDQFIAITYSISVVPPAGL